MFLHLQIPGFHAAVHQALHRETRGRPVAVAVDAGPQAPLFATSVQARAHHIHSGLRADLAQRRCPGLIVVPPDPDAYRRAQQRLSQICGAYTPRVAAIAGRLDLDLAGTEPLWRQRLGDVGPQATPETLATVIAGRIRHLCAEELHLDAYLGGSSRLLVARLAAHLARELHLAASRGLVIVQPGDEAAVTDLMPVSLLAECEGHVRELLERCGIRTIGQLRALSAHDLIGLVGPGGGGLFEALHGLREEIVPELVDPEPSVSACCRGKPGGVGLEVAHSMITVLAREIGFHLRQRHLAATRLGLEVTWIDARVTTRSLTLPYQSAHDHDLNTAGQHLLLQAASRRVYLGRLRLTGTGLCTAEEQQELFGGGRDHRLETARDRIRTRFGSDLVTTPRAPSVSGV